MKKNRMMRLASTLLVAVLITTSTISGTYAKYVTADDATDTARVAEFGVRIDAQAEMFHDTYKGVEAEWTSKNTVDGEGDNVVAPGTEGEMIDLKITGTPEVAVRVNYEVKELLLEDWTLYDDSEYCPVVFIINGNEYGTVDSDADTENKSADVAALIEDIKDAVSEYSKEYEPNKNLNDDEAKAEYLTIGWRWDFDANDDTKDTVLGDKAAGIAMDGSPMDKSPATINITVECTVTQID